MRGIAEALERGHMAFRLPSALSGFVARRAAAFVVRPLALPPGIRVVAVGGATLGGSGKTSLAIACAAELANAGARVALIGHAYRASPRRPRLVSPEDELGEVGDEALLAAQVLQPLGARVVVAPNRAEALAFAARVVDVVVLDGVAQTAPVRASLALLAVDAFEPWGHARAMPPGGDLRAPKDALMAASDIVVSVGEGGTAAAKSRGVWLGQTLCTWSEVASLRVGLICALARPDRVVRSLGKKGVVPSAVLCGPDHGPLGMWTLRRAARWLRWTYGSPRQSAQCTSVPRQCAPDCALLLPPSTTPWLSRRRSFGAFRHSRRLDRRAAGQ